MEKFIYYLYKTTSFFIFFLGLIYIINLNKIIGLVITCISVFLYMISMEYEKSINRKYFVDRKLYKNLYKKYSIYKKYEDVLSLEDKELINNSPGDDFEIEYLYK